MARSDLTRAEVAEARRPAWSGSPTGGSDDYYFDGTNFWLQPRFGGTLNVSARQAPEHPWCHKPGCDCPLCYTGGPEAEYA